MELPHHKAFIHYDNFLGIVFLFKLQQLNDTNIRNLQICVRTQIIFLF